MTIVLSTGLLAIIAGATIGNLVYQHKMDKRLSRNEAKTDLLLAAEGYELDPETAESVIEQAEKREGRHA